MIKYTLILLFAVLNLQYIAAQTNPDSTIQGSVNTSHKIVFQLTTDDSIAHKALMKQIRNITSVAPETLIEVVCHGPGLSMLMNNKSTVLSSIQELHNDKISFVACEFSMKERNVSKEQIIAVAGFVKAGIIEIVTKQEQGWSYIKSGF